MIVKLDVLLFLALVSTIAGTVVSQQVYWSPTVLPFLRQSAATMALVSWALVGTAVFYYMKSDLERSALQAQKEREQEGQQADRAT